MMTMFGVVERCRPEQVIGLVAELLLLVAHTLSFLHSSVLNSVAKQDAVSSKNQSDAAALWVCHCHVVHHLGRIFVGVNGSDSQP